jgi:23S rRNA (pseudouridine1915-N3)-methyltransferase
MLHCRILVFGKVKQRGVEQLVSEYVKRLGRFVKIEIVELRGGDDRSAAVQDVLSAEADELLKKVSERDYLVILDERGKALTSAQFSGFLSEQMTKGISKVVFAIGGAFGWDNRVRDRANIQLSLSSLTFPYQLVRVILVEQIYRAITLMHGIPYHK